MDIEEILNRHGSSLDRLSDTVSSSDVYERQFGAELTEWELRLQKQFQERVSSRLLKYRGFVHYTRDTSLIMLTPSPWLIDGIFIYFKQDQAFPVEGSLVEVTGRSVVAPRLLEQGQGVVRAITAENVETLQKLWHYSFG